MPKSAFRALWHQPEDGREVEEANLGRGPATGPKAPRSTALSAEEEAVIVAFRRYPPLPLHDCLYAL